MTSERGFSLVEVMVSTFILLAVTGAVFTLVNPAQGTYRAQPEVSDMQQRVRVAANALQQDLVMAGGGTYLGDASGSLLNFFAPVMPIRMTATGSDMEAGVFYRPDAVTIMYVPSTSAQTTVASDMPQPSAEIKVEHVVGCPDSDRMCGFYDGQRAVIFDESGSFDPFIVTHVQETGSIGHLQHNRDDFSKAYNVNARVAALRMLTYYLQTNVQTNTFQLRQFDGQNDQPFVDNVVAFELEYLGDPRGPTMLRPVTETPGPWTSYGPTPPPLTASYPGSPYPNGENCAFTKDEGTGLQVTRLADLSGQGASLVPLTEAMLTDGPWCPNNVSPMRFDADLLRVRTIRVRLRVQAASATLRGPAGVLFSYGGTSSGGTTFVPDLEVHFDVSPRNMNFGR